MFFSTGSIPGFDVDYLWILIVTFVMMSSLSCLSSIPAFPELVENAEDIYKEINYDSEEMNVRMGGVSNFLYNIGAGIGTLLG